MNLERGRIIEILVSVAAVGAFVIVLLGIGLTYNQDGMGETGGLALVVSVGLFILVMAGVGYALTYLLYDE